LAGGFVERSDGTGAEAVHTGIGTLGVAESPSGIVREILGSVGLDCPACRLILRRGVVAFDSHPSPLGSGKVLGQVETRTGALGITLTGGVAGGDITRRDEASISPCRCKYRGGFFGPVSGTGRPSDTGGIVARGLSEANGKNGGEGVFGKPDCDIDTCLTSFRNPDLPGNGVKVEETGTGILGMSCVSQGVGSGVIFGKTGPVSDCESLLGPTMPSLYCAVAVPMTRICQLRSLLTWYS
jgi:hypothetical protein